MLLFYLLQIVTFDCFHHFQNSVFFYWLGEAKLTIDLGSNAPQKPAHLAIFDTIFNRGIKRIIDVWQSYFQ